MSRVEFFSKIENKYNIGLKKNRAVVLRFDARNTTANSQINLLDETEGSFSYALKKTAEILSKKYSYLYIYVACDEINIFITDTKKMLSRMKSNYAQEITCIFAQEISYIFHKYYKEFVLFAGRSFSVYQDNLNSYLIYRLHTNRPVLTTYFLKRNTNVNHRKPYLIIHNYAEENIPEYNKRTHYQKEGLIYYKGFSFEVEDVLKYKLEELYKKKITISVKEIIDDDI